MFAAASNLSYPGSQALLGNRPRKLRFPALNRAGGYCSVSIVGCDRLRSWWFFRLLGNRWKPGTSMISKVKWKTEIFCVPGYLSAFFSTEFDHFSPAAENPWIFGAAGLK